MIRTLSRASTAWIERAVLERVDLLIINKFGKEEAHGRGLRAAIAEALIAEIPLVIGVSTQNLRDFLTFVGDSATRLEARHRGNYGLVPERD